jgi:LysR family transcriptional regulator, regulator for metE and metH
MYSSSMTAELDRHHYETLVAIVDHGSLTAAARVLNIGQSSLSHRLAEAERRVGIALFERRPARPLQPTPAGLVLYQAAQRALPDLVRAEADVGRLRDAPSKVVRIGVGSYDCYHWFAGFNRYVGEHLPGVLLELVVVGDTPSTKLADGSVDVVIAPGAPIGPHLSSPLFDDELVIITAPGHFSAGQFAAVGWLPAAAIEGEVFFTYNKQPTPGFESDHFLVTADGAPRSFVVIQQTGAIAEMVGSGLGISILSRWAMSSYLSAGAIIAYRCGESGLSVEWSALVRAGAAPDGVEAEVVVALQEYLPSTFLI